MQIIGETPTPTGEPGILVECTCATHATNGQRAILRAVARRGLTQHPERIHGFVTVAHHPFLARAKQTRENGPWAA